jgi:SAM-dependent methyltransferase
MAVQTANHADYVLGTGEDEIARLKLQHDVWQELAMHAWQAAGIGPGSAVLDVGCGPGFGTLDLCRTVGAEGRVTAIEGSEQFIEAGKAMLSGNGQTGNILQVDIDRYVISPAGYDFIWCRWVASFVNQPRRLAKQIAKGLSKGGAAIFHEYMHYGTWRILPRSEQFERFVSAVQQSWSDAGGFSDIATDLIGWLEKEGLSVEVKPHIFIASPGEPMWNWPTAFVETNIARLEELGVLNSQQAKKIRDDWQLACKTPGVRMVTPCVAEIVARKR